MIWGTLAMGVSSLGNIGAMGMAVALERETSALDFALSASLVPALAHPGRRQRESIPSQMHHLPRASVAQDLFGTRQHQSLLYQRQTLRVSQIESETCPEVNCTATVVLEVKDL
jgi:hypothetical protein